MVHVCCIHGQPYSGTCLLQTWTAVQWYMSAAYMDSHTVIHVCCRHGQPYSGTCLLHTWTAVQWYISAAYMDSHTVIHVCCIHGQPYSGTCLLQTWTAVQWYMSAAYMDSHTVIHVYLCIAVSTRPAPPVFHQWSVRGCAGAARGDVVTHSLHPPHPRAQDPQPAAPTALVQLSHGQLCAACCQERYLKSGHTCTVI